MAITYPLSLPTNTSIQSMTLRAKNTVAMSVSPFTYAQQAVAHSGQIWEADIKLPSMKRKDAEEWVAFLLSLRGMLGTFKLGDSVGATARGALGGTPVVNGGSQLGGVLNINGASNSVTNWLKAGDYIQLGTEGTATLHKVLKNASSDGSGNVSLDIWPYIASSPSSGAAVVTSNTYGRFRLASNEQNWDINHAATYGIVFGAVGVR
jgi:hypothetical protein